MELLGEANNKKNLCPHLIHALGLSGCPPPPPNPHTCLSLSPLLSHTGPLRPTATLSLRAMPDTLMFIVRDSMGAPQAAPPWLRRSQPQAGAGLLSSPLSTSLKRPLHLSPPLSSALITSLHLSQASPHHLSPSVAALGANNIRRPKENKKRNRDNN